MKVQKRGLKYFLKVAWLKIAWWRSRYWCSECLMRTPLKVTRGTRWGFPFEIEVWCKRCGGFLKNIPDIREPFTLHPTPALCLYCGTKTDAVEFFDSHVCEECQTYGQRKCRECRYVQRRYQPPLHAIPYIHEGMAMEDRLLETGYEWHACRIRDGIGKVVEKFKDSMEGQFSTAHVTPPARVKCFVEVRE